MFIFHGPNIVRINKKSYLKEESPLRHACAFSDVNVDIGSILAYLGNKGRTQFASTGYLNPWYS